MPHQPLGHKALALQCEELGLVEKGRAHMHVLEFLADVAFVLFMDRELWASTVFFRRYVYAYARLLVQVHDRGHCAQCIHACA